MEGSFRKSNVKPWPGVLSVLEWILECQQFVSAGLAFVDPHFVYLGSAHNLAPDASLKQFFRIMLKQRLPLIGPAKPWVRQDSVIVMCIPQAGKPADLLMLDYYEQLSQFFEAIPVTAASVLARLKGGLVFEDIGDQKLLDVVGNFHAQEIDLHYRKALVSLVKLQNYCQSQGVPDFVQSRHLSFCTTKLMAEVNHTLSQLELFFQQPLSREIRGFLEQSFEQLSQKLQQEVFVLCHRDFHSRNLMAAGSEVIWIDYQDARMGSALYDAASLLRDSYVYLTQAQVEAYFNFYLDQKEITVLAERKKLREQFDEVSLQRNFKAIGSFLGVFNQRKNPHFLKYVGSTFEQMFRYGREHSHWSKVLRILFEQYHRQM
jgi:aminoglycoside/choline kinase family phosphotransferase